MKRILSTLILFAAAIIQMQAQRFQSGELWYNITDTETKTVEVTYEKQYDNYPTISPDVVVPETVVYQQEEYTVTGISADAFRGCFPLTSITISKNVACIGDSAFYVCESLAKVTLPESLQTIGVSAFFHCSSLAEINIPKGVTFIGESAFYACRSLAKVTLPESLQTIEDFTFYDCLSLTEIKIPEGVTFIGKSAFNACESLAEVTLPESLQTIKDNVFKQCLSLAEIKIPEGVTFIGESIFSGCESLKKIIVLANNPPVAKEEVFDGVASKATVYVPASALEVYRQTAPWKIFNLQPIDTGTAIETTTTADDLRIEAGRLHNPQAIHIEIFDLQGRIVYQGAQTNINLPEGIYLVRGKGVNRKVMITK